jgi:iron complex outermembrane receptor protein
MSSFSFRSLSVLLFLAALSGRAQSASPAPAAVSAPASNVTSSGQAEVLNLDKVVVSAGLDDKTAFDLAQGTSILAAEELHQHATGTLGATLDATPGVSSTSYGPGASRPVIRGLGGDRIRVLDNGVGALDASNISPDHNTALEPLFATRIEVLRGPATLLYGSSAVGGVVNVIDNAIPAAALSGPPTGAIELRGLGAAHERTGVLAVGAGRGHLALQIDGLRQDSGDLAIPGVARIDTDAPPGQPAGTLPNSDISSKSGSVGATWFTGYGRLGAAVSTYATTYGVPTDEPISIAMQQRRFDLQGEATSDSGFFRGVRARFGFGDYTHSEIADRTTVNTTFYNQAWEGRLELPYSLPANLSGTLGFQAARSDFSAVGEEVVTPPSITASQALFALQEWKSETWTVQAGGRLERQSLELGAVDPALPAVAGYAARSGEKNVRTGASGSLGTVYHPARDWALSLNLAYTERLPTAQERFSNGPHGGTGAYEVGTTGLGRERSTGLDLSLRRRAGFVTGSLTGFVNRFRNYIYEQELGAGAIPVANNPENLTVYQFVAKDALFYGGEAELTFHLLERNDHSLHLGLTSDYVHAEQTTDDVPLPRMPPLRFGAELRYQTTHWQVGLMTRIAARQDRIAAEETATAGYVLLNADLAYVLTSGRTTYEFFLRGDNLTDEEARVSTSFLKDFAPLAGRGATAGVRMTF